MTDGELLELLMLKQWTEADKKRLVDEWNLRRGDSVGRIGMIQVRTSCRLRQIRDSMLAFMRKNVVN